MSVLLLSADVLEVELKEERERSQRREHKRGVTKQNSFSTKEDFRRRWGVFLHFFSFLPFSHRPPDSTTMPRFAATIAEHPEVSPGKGKERRKRVWPGGMRPADFVSGLLSLPVKNDTTPPATIVELRPPYIMTGTGRLVVAEVQRYFPTVVPRSVFEGRWDTLVGGMNAASYYANLYNLEGCLLRREQPNYDMMRAAFIMICQDVIDYVWIPKSDGYADKDEAEIAAAGERRLWAIPFCDSRGWWDVVVVDKKERRVLFFCDQEEGRCGIGTGRVKEYVRYYEEDVGEFVVVGVERLEEEDGWASAVVAMENLRVHVREPGGGGMEGVLTWNEGVLAGMSLPYIGAVCDRAGPLACWLTMIYVGWIRAELGHRSHTRLRVPADPSLDLRSYLTHLTRGRPNAEYEATDRAYARILEGPVDADAVARWADLGLVEQKQFVKLNLDTWVSGELGFFLHEYLPSMQYYSYTPFGSAKPSPIMRYLIPIKLPEKDGDLTDYDDDAPTTTVATAAVMPQSTTTTTTTTTRATRARNVTTGKANEASQPIPEPTAATADASEGARSPPITWTTTLTPRVLARLRKGYAHKATGANSPAAMMARGAPAMPPYFKKYDKEYWEYLRVNGFGVTEAGEIITGEWLLGRQSAEARGNAGSSTAVENEVREVSEGEDEDVVARESVEVDEELGLVESDDWASPEQGGVVEEAMVFEDVEDIVAKGHRESAAAGVVVSRAPTPVVNAVGGRRALVVTIRRGAGSSSVVERGSPSKGQRKRVATAKGKEMDEDRKAKRPRGREAKRAVAEELVGAMTKAEALAKPFVYGFPADMARSQMAPMAKRGWRGWKVVWPGHPKYG